MNKVCPRCNSTDIADVVYGLLPPVIGGGLPEGCVAGGCAINDSIQWKCQNCGFDWGPIKYFINGAKNLEEKYWRGAEFCLLLKEAEQGSNMRLSKIKKKINGRKDLSLDEIETIELNITTCSIDMAMEANKFVREGYESLLAQVSKGDILDVDEDTLKRRYEPTSDISKIWEAMSNFDRDAVKSFRAYNLENSMARLKDLKYKIKILEEGQLQTMSD